MIDWEKNIEPLLTGPYIKSSNNESELESLVESILTNSKNILEHDSMHECFYSSFVALVGCYFSNSFVEVSNYLSDDFVTACKILMEFCLNRLRTFDVQCAVPQKNLMQLISSLCIGENKFSKGDIITFTAMLKSATLPMIVRKSTDPEEQPAKPAEKRRDATTQMRMTFQLYGTGMSALTTSSDKVDKTVIAERNIDSLKKLTAQESLLLIYLNLPYLKRYINRENDFVLGNPLILPSTQLAAITVRNGLGPLSSNINIILQIISLPLLEPLNKEKIENLSKLALSCFYAGLSVTAAMTVLSESKGPSAGTSGTGKMSKEPDYKSIADKIVNDIIKIYERVSNVLTSTRISSRYLQNFQLLSANIIAQGLETIFGLDEKKQCDGKEKKQQPINRLTLTLSSILTDILQFLIQDCSLEYEEQEKEEDSTESGSVLSIHGVADGIKRFSCLTNKLNILRLLSSIVHLSFEFVYTAKCTSQTESSKVLKDVPLGDDSGASEDDTYEFESSEELFSSSGDEEEGNGSFGFSGGPILGEWFIRILEGREESEVLPSIPSCQSADAKRPRISSFAEKVKFQVETEIYFLEMEKVLANCNKIIRLINSGFVSTTCEVIKSYVKRNLTADIVYKLASVLQHIRLIPLELLSGCPVLPFLHSLITSDLLTEDLQTVVLQAHDIVDPAKQIVASPASLSLLFKILFQNQMQAKSKDKDYPGVTEFMNKLVDHFIKQRDDIEKILEVKVEVIQMCLMLFHTLTKTSQRSFFKSLYVALETCTDTGVVPLSTSRILTMFEYLMHHYSHPSDRLLEHVQHNLLTMHLEDPRTFLDLFDNVKILDELYFHIKKYTPFKYDDQLLQNVKVFRKLVKTQQEENKTGSPKHKAQIYNEVFYDLTYGDEENIELDPGIYEVIEECGLDYDTVHTTVFYSLEAGRKCVRMQSVESQEKQEDIKTQLAEVHSVLGKLLMNYNFRIVFRMLRNLSPPEALRFVIQEDVSTFTSTPIQVLMSLVMLTKMNKDEGKDKEKLFLQLMKLATIYLEKHFLPLEDKEDILPLPAFPPIMEIMVLDCLLSEIHFSLWLEEKKMENELETTFLSMLLQALTYVGKLCRSYILHASKIPENEAGRYNLIMKTNLSNWSITAADIPALPDSIRNQLQDWDAGEREKVFGSDPVSHTTDNILHQYLKSMNDKDPFLTGLKYVTASLCLIQKELSTLFKSSVSVTDAAKCLIPLQTDIVLMKFCNEYSTDLKCIEIAPDSELYRDTMCYHIVRQIYNLIVVHNSKDTYAVAYLKYLENLLLQEDSLNIKRALYQFFVGSKETKTTLKVDPKVESKKPTYKGIDVGFTGDFVIFILSCSSKTTEEFSNALFSLVAKICEASIGTDADPHLVAIASEMNQLLDVPPDLLQDWINNFSLIIESDPKPESSHITGDILMKLARLITHPDSPVDHSLALLVLQSSSVIPAENLKKGSMDVFLTILMTLAEGKQGLGHLGLFKTSLNWLKACRAELSATNYRQLTSENENIVTTCELILFYIMDVLLVLHGVKGEDGYENDLGADLEEESIIHEEEINRDMEHYDITRAEMEYADSEALWTKLCTYTSTQKEFMNQHWYHCYTCDMTERTGVCSICAKVCHKGHDLSYAKYGSFFCDCGARGAKACKALTKRSPVIEDPAPSGSSSDTTVAPTASSSANSLPAAKISAFQTPTVSDKPQEVGKVGKNKRKHKRLKLCKVLDGCRDQLLAYLKTDEGREKTFGLLLEVISDLEKIVLSESYRSMTFHTNAHAITTLKNLRTLEKETKCVENLMVPTLGSQEGAFENVKPNFTGEQGQTIRQLINTRMIFRVSMCCLSSGSGRRHHLAISHEKTKLTILQLSALLKQADANKRRLTLTTLSTTQMPFPIVTLSSNPCNEEVLAVCGLKDCHILTLTSSGIVNDHLVLHPQLSTGNYIIKAIWLPGSQCEIALITADFVKIYDLATEILAPEYYFLLPTGKIRDATFVVSNNGTETVTYLIVMSSSGYMYTQQLYADCSAAHGPFYVTNALSVSDDSLKEKNGQVGNGGISVYYSHALQLLFFSYATGKNFAATLDTELEQAMKLFNIPYKNSNGKSNSNGSTALYVWHEVIGHPGLISCFSHSTGVPVALMIDPEHIHLQEIKSTNAKAKIQDIVAVRHSSSDDAERSTVIALCEDGSLRIYLVNQETTGFWLSSNLQPVSVFNRGQGHSGKDSDSSSESSKSKEQDQANLTEPVFPIDFFESCQLINGTDLEFGGETLLQVYNPTQIRNRLNNQGMYIVSKGMFSIDITNKNKNMVVTGIRLQIGNKGSDSAPTHIYIGERYISLGMRLKKPRWFDFPMTREESIKFSNKLTIVFGCSVHPDDYNIVDCIKLYGKTKDSFGWQEEDTKAAASSSESQTKTKGKNHPPSGKAQEKTEETKEVGSQRSDFADSPPDKLLLACLASLNCCFTDSKKEKLTDDMKTKALCLASNLIVRPLHLTIHSQIKQLMMNLLEDKESYHKFKDMTVLKNASKCLKTYNEATETPAVQGRQTNEIPVLCADEFQAVLVELSGISVRRPSNLSAIENYPEQDVVVIDLENESSRNKEVIASDMSLSEYYCTHLQDLMKILMKFIKEKPRHRFLSPPCLPGIKHIESTVKSFIDVVHAAAMTIPSVIDMAADIYFTLLTSEQILISSATRSALVRLLKPLTHQPGTRMTRSNSKSTDTAPSTRSNSPPATLSNQIIVTATTGSELMLTSNQIPQGYHQAHSFIGGPPEGMNEDLEDEDDDSDAEYEEIGGDEGPLDEDEIMMQEREDGIAPSLNRDEQLMAMQEMEENQAQVVVPVQNQDSQNEESQGNSQVQSGLRRLQDLMDNSHSYFLDANTSLEDMIMDAHDEEFASFEGDDEAMVELAIALSLQQSGGGSGVAQHQQHLQHPEHQQHLQQQQGNNNQSPEEIASQVLNEIVQEAVVDETSLPFIPSTQDDVVTTPDVSHVPPPPQTSHSVQEQPSSSKEFTRKEWEGVTRSSDVGFMINSSSSSPTNDSVFPPDKIESMRVSLVERFLKRMKDIVMLERGERSIPYFQVLFLFTNCLHPEKEEEKALLEKVVLALIEDLVGHSDNDPVEDPSTRTPRKEIVINQLRCLMLLLSSHREEEKDKQEKQPKDESHLDDVKDEEDVSKTAEGEEKDKQQDATSIASVTANILISKGINDMCFGVLMDLLSDYWDVPWQDKSDPVVETKLLKPNTAHNIPNFSPIVFSHYVKAHSDDIFKAYPELLTEGLLRLMYRIKKFCDQNPSLITLPSDDWLTNYSSSFTNILANYMLHATHIPVIKKEVRKILLYMCGSKESYRKFRDSRALSYYFNFIIETWDSLETPSRTGVVNFPYDEMISVVAYLEQSLAIAQQRTISWQIFCHSKLKTCMEFLLKLSLSVNETVSSTILQLLICTVSTKSKSKKDYKAVKDGKVETEDKEKISKQENESSNKPTTSDKSGDKVSFAEESGTSDDTALGTELCCRFLLEVDEDVLRMFLLRFLLEINTSAVRWNAHKFVQQLFQNTKEELRSKLIDVLWQLWPVMPDFGHKAVQFVDLLGYLSIENGLDPEKSQLYTDAAFGMLRKQNNLLTNHPNSMLYMQLANFVDFDGYYLEINPCLVCNQPEIPFATIKLASIKSDTKYTTTQHIIKLTGSYKLQKVTIKVTDIKQTKMIRKASLYYNNKKVPAIIELKNKPKLWHKAKQLTLNQGQTEIRFDLPLPAVATNLMIEFSEFYENVSATTETLQCPRCSASVQANPGICGNCGENVFQCHKCRSINYDEKDPFLCNVCGFSKYAKFDITLLAKPCCAVDTIENEDDRKKAVGEMTSLLDMADSNSNSIIRHKNALDAILFRIEKLTSEPLRPVMEREVVSATARVPIMSNPNQTVTLTSGQGAVPSAGSNVNIHIQKLAREYCMHTKETFESLSKHIKTILASRKEIIEYDQRQKMSLGDVGEQSLENQRGHMKTTTTSVGKGSKSCYGCAVSSAKQCIVLLRGLATDETSRKRLVDKGLITELVQVSLRRGNAETRKQVQGLIGQLVKNDQEASAELNNILLSRITSSMLHHNHDLFPSSVYAEMNLLVSMLAIQDSCWQLRLRTVVQLFHLSVKMQSPAIIENVTLPCLKILRSKAAPAVPEVTSRLIVAAKNSQEVTLDARAWLACAHDHDFESWKQKKIKMQISAPSNEDRTKEEVRETYLAEKYMRKWLRYVESKKTERKKAKDVTTKLSHNWLRQMLFCRSSVAVREVACMIVTSIAENKSRKAQILDLLTSYLDELGDAGEASSEFVTLYTNLFEDAQWKVYLAKQDILPQIGKLIQIEISNLLRMEDSTVFLDLQQGKALKELTDILCEFVKGLHIPNHYKGKLVGTVLNSYLSLRKLVIQRTSFIDEAQDILLGMLEDITSGTESETKAFMAVCIETINKYEMSDIKTPQFIFERLSNIIFPEENNTSEFFLYLEKDPLQEDFLQGRMVGNPYGCNEPGLSPLMRDVKNKICRDSDLVALLEDDNGMELLVNNKIISLDLPVREVYNKVWLPNHGEVAAMRVVYRMRGLLGEATEDIIDKLDSKVDERDEEEVYKMASVLIECGGVEVMLQRLEAIQNLAHGRQLADSILKLMMYVVRLKENRKYLMKPGLNTLNVLLGALNLGLQSGEDGVPLVEQLLKVMDRVLQEAAADDKTQIFTGDKEKLTLLLQQIDSELVRTHVKILRGLMRIIPFLSFGDPDLMQMLIDHFKSYLDLEKFDEGHTAEDSVYLDCFCEIGTGIQDNPSGYQLKDLIIVNRVVNNSLAYISHHVPQHKNFESDDWKQFVSRPALPYCLRLLAGLSAKHSPTQTLIGQTSIPDLHRLEQVSTQESIGSLAENVLEAISENEDVAKNVKEVRKETRSEKKRLAMAVRQKELGALGMKTNAKGQVVTQTPLLKQIGDLVEESGLTCIICREGYKFEPKKVLGIYTYSKRCSLEEFEGKPRKQQGYTTVSHFNVVHYDCHTSAVRAARGREEWESAMLQNTSTKCNGLLPLWGPHVPESAFATCLARHNTYLQEATGYKEPNVTSTVHDLKHLLLRFAHERSFSEETGGGGPQSNVHLLPYMIHMTQYVINTTRSSSREEKSVANCLTEKEEKWIESSYDVDGPLYITALSLFVCDTTKWRSSRIMFLKRLIVLCQVRQSSTSVITKLQDRVVKSYDTYKPFLLFWSMVDLIYEVLFKNAPTAEASETWSSTLANYIRHNDSVLLETSEKMVTKFQKDYIPVSSLEEFADVASIYEEIGSSMEEFIKKLLESSPN